MVTRSSVSVAVKSPFLSLAMTLSEKVIARCQELARFTETAGGTSRPFLCPAMHECHRLLKSWMESAGMRVKVDAAGNLRGLYAGENVDGGRLLIGSHLDTVPDAGPYDGVLGVVLAIALIESAKGRRFPHEIEIVGFSEEEGVRFGIPFIGSRALVGRIDEELLKTRDSQGISVESAIAEFGLDPAELPRAEVSPQTIGYLEFHLEQGPLLASINKPLGVVESVVGQCRVTVQFAGEASHAGSSPMHLRRDALTGAAEWIGMVEQEARSVTGLVATVGQLEVLPGVNNVVPSKVSASLDMRHPSDKTLGGTIERLLEKARHVAQRRKLRFDVLSRLDLKGVPMNPALVNMAERAVRMVGCPSTRMVSGVGHDAMIMAEKVPSVMIFIRTPSGPSPRCGENVDPADIEMALNAGLQFLNEFSGFKRAKAYAFA